MSEPVLLERDRAEGAYERDLHRWALTQARLLRERRFAELDVANIVEELESLGREQAAKLRSSYRVLLLHLLKWAWQPGRRSRSWRATVVRERGLAEQQLQDNPSLKPRRRQLFTEAHRLARKEAAAETGLPLDRFPVECPFTLEQAMDEEFWPEGA
ncbi:MAG TPA: DUF29 domain-containing protein [Geminicoccaceae bacterium]|nr:DUF29 domain-containing protein [Geminicoccaceae bacterium]